MFSPDQVPSKIEKILDSGMSCHESLGLPYRFESPHPSLSNSGSFVGLLHAIIPILFRTMDRLRNNFPMCHTIASQLIRNDLPGFAFVAPYQPFEKARCRSTISFRL